MADLEVKKIGHIEIDRTLCIGAATCLAVSPDTFELDNEVKAVIKNSHGNTDEEIWDSVRSCPTKAIKLFDEKGKQMYP